MKKTLLSIMTMAILASGSASAAKTMTIDVTAEIPVQLTLTKADDTPVGVAKLKTFANPGEYDYKEKIKISGNGAGKNFNVKMVTPLSLVHDIDKSIEFEINTVNLGAHALQAGKLTTQTRSYSKAAGSNAAELELNIIANAPLTQNTGTYSGTVSLEIEEAA
ncbi:TPA: CS1 type fimbrial major subunit [Yersinia enterocolitica]